MHVALCFWGLLRSLKYCIDSIRTHCLIPLKHKNHTFDIFIHTYNFAGNYTNSRTKEESEMLNFSEWKLLDPYYVHVENQDEFDSNTNYSSYATQGDPWNNNLESLRNHIRALNSLYHLTIVLENLHRKNMKNYDAVVFLRPDVQYLNELPVDLLTEHPSTLFLADFHRSCKGREYNDRFAMGTMETALINAIRAIEFPFRFRRVRVHGNVHKRDVDMPTPLQQLAVSPDGSSPHHTPWLLKYIGVYKSDIDDPFNVYCTPNLKLWPHEVYGFYVSQGISLDGIGTQKDLENYLYEYYQNFLGESAVDDYALLDYTLHQPKTHSNADGTITRPSGEFKEGDDLSINQLTGYRRLETKKRKRRRRYLRSHPDVVD